MSEIVLYKKLKKKHTDYKKTQQQQRATARKCSEFSISLQKIFYVQELSDFLSCSFLAFFSPMFFLHKMDMKLNVKAEQDLWSR